MRGSVLGVVGVAAMGGVLLVGVVGPRAWARPAAPVPDVFDADDPTVLDDDEEPPEPLDDFTADDEDVVLAAQKVRTTIQEAPSIITVITRAQIQARGYRTVNELVSSVPGFEGDRWEANGWHKEAFVRGLPRTVLVLLNGVNIIEPSRNYVNLDRKIPLEMVERVEVTSGPGGVLWGSNALLGVINIITRGPDTRGDGPGGVELLAGFGDGPGDRLQAKGVVGIHRRFSDSVGLFAMLNYYTTLGPELTMDTMKVVGSLPAPAEDGPTLYLPGARTLSAGARSHYLNFSGRLQLGPVDIDWMVPWERDYRVYATGNAPAVLDFLQPSRGGQPSRSSDSVYMGSIRYRDRFLGGDLGLQARAYYTQWTLNEDPFRVYPASPVILATQGHTRELDLAMVGDLIARSGVSLDVDYRLLDGLTLLGGGEFFGELQHGLSQVDWQPLSDGRCPPGYTYVPDDPHLPCRVKDVLSADTERYVGGAFVNLDWRPVSSLALTGGARLQVANTYDPAVLWSGGVVWNMFDHTNAKLFVSSGLRPPSFNSTHVRETHSGISFKANPNLDVETSHSYEVELNGMFLRDVSPVRDLFLRVNGAYTQMLNVIGRPGGVYQNSGAQRIWTAEAALRLRFEGGHSLWGNYTYTRVFDDTAPGGELRNFAAHMGNVGATVSFLDGAIELDGFATFKGSMNDPNRPPLVDPARPDYSMSCASLAQGVYPEGTDLAQLQSLCGMPGMSEGIWVFPGTRVVEKLRPVVLLNLGIRFRKLWRDLTASIYVYNALDARYFEPDFFNDERVISRPQPKPGLSIFGKLSLGL